MPDWIAKANIDHFKKLLETEKDSRKRAMMERELAEEKAKLAGTAQEARLRQERGLGERRPKRTWR